MWWGYSAFSFFLFPYMLRGAPLHPATYFHYDWCLSKFYVFFFSLQVWKRDPNPPVWKTHSICWCRFLLFICGFFTGVTLPGLMRFLMQVLVHPHFLGLLIPACSLPRLIGLRSLAFLPSLVVAPHCLPLQGLWCLSAGTTPPWHKGDRKIFGVLHWRQ